MCVSHPTFAQPATTGKKRDRIPCHSDSRAGHDPAHVLPGSALTGGQRLLQVGQYVVDVLDAHTQPHGFFFHAGFFQLRR